MVDSGGQGLMEFLTGAYNGLTGKEEIKEPVTSGGAAKAQTMSSEEIDTSHIKYGYCTEFIIMLEKEYNAEIEAKFKEFLTSIGDSLVVVSDDEIVKVHVHTNHPGLAFEKGLEYGSLTSMKVDNMREEHKEKVIHEQDRKKAAEQEAAKPPRALTPQRHGDGRSLRKILQADAERDADRAHDRLRRRAALQCPKGHADSQPLRDIVQCDREDEQNDTVRPVTPLRSAADTCDHAVRCPEEDGS